MQIVRCSFDFTINGARLRIFVNGERPNLVHTDEFRPSSMRTTDLATVISKIEAHEFADDIQSMLKLFEKQYEPHQNILMEILAEICMVHIEKHNRLILSDLHVYFDELLIILNHFEIEKGGELYVEQGTQIWSMLNEQAQILFKNHLWIPSPVFPHQPIKLNQ